MMPPVSVYSLNVSVVGLKCFVVKSAEQEKHIKHPRRGKGTCADPATVDESKGKFIPLRTESKQ